MAELIPSLNTCLAKMTSGEKRVARCLESLLEDDYLCWYDIPVGGKRRYPDFIVLHPSRGLLFLEVKDWKPDHIKKLSPSSVSLLTPSGLKTVANPIEQARQCSYQVLNMLETDPALQQKSARYKGKLCCPYGYGVVLTNISRKQLDKAIPEEMRSKLLPSHLVLCKDDIANKADPEVFQEKLWGMFNYSFGEKLTLPQIDRIRWHLFPEIRIDDNAQTDLFADEKPGVSDCMPDIVRIMDIQQEQLARSLGEGHRVIHGVAGSGKTLILGYRCLHLAELLHKPILVLCFNITLAAKLRRFIGDKGISDKVQVQHFHDWCGQQLKTYHVDVVPGATPYWERQVDSVIKGVDDNLIPRGQYGAVLIDEGHDFEAEWLKLVSQMVDPDTNSLLLLYDDAQSIYQKKTLKFSLASVGIQAQGRTTVLRLNYRNTQEILHFAYEFAKSYFSANTDAEIPLIEPEASGMNGKAPHISAAESATQEIEAIIAQIRLWQQEGLELNDIAVLYPVSGTGKQLFDAIKAAGIPCNWMANSNYKRKFDPSMKVINLMPIPSSKGLEFDAVISADSSFLRQGDDQQALKETAKLLYVGFTRARKQLYVSYHRENRMSHELEKLKQPSLHAGKASCNF